MIDGIGVSSGEIGGEVMGSSAIDAALFSDNKVRNCAGGGRWSNGWSGVIDEESARDIEAVASGGVIAIGIGDGVSACDAEDVVVEGELIACA